EVPPLLGGDGEPCELDLHTCQYAAGPARGQLFGYHPPMLTRRTWMGGVAAAGALAALPRGKKGESKAGVKVGLVVPQSGVYAPLGVDMKRAWDLYLSSHGGKLGKLDVTTVVADEGESPQSGVPAVQKLMANDQVDVLVGIVNSAIALG